MRRRTVFLINCVGVMERMDEQIVPALSRPLGCAFRAGPHALGLITFARALVQAVASPLGGIAVSAGKPGGRGRARVRQGVSAGAALSSVHIAVACMSAAPSPGAKLRYQTATSAATW